LEYALPTHRQRFVRSALQQRPLLFSYLFPFGIEVISCQKIKIV
jgi:hypothetical protein